MIINKKLKIAFVLWWKRASEIYPLWRDGLRSAIELVGKKHDVKWFLDEDIPFPDEEFDWLIFWGDSTCPLFNWLHQYKAKKGIFLTTDVYDWDNMKKLDVIFAESQPIVDSIKEKGLNVIKAFGTDTDFYDPAFNYDKKTIGYFYPATFSPWKKQSTIAY